MEMKGSKTEKNILTAFAGESQARNRYTYFASQAKKDGFVQMQAIFQETADQEKEHAKRFNALKSEAAELKRKLEKIETRWQLKYKNKNEELLKSTKEYCEQIHAYTGTIEELKSKLNTKEVEQSNLTDDYIRDVNAARDSTGCTQVRSIR